jgi:RuvB-like protein 2
MAYKTSLRYALNLIAPSHLLAQRRKSPQVEVDDVKLAYKYFIDVERSANYAQATAGMMFGEEEEGAEPKDMTGSRMAMDLTG